ncbi:MAG: aspartate kinase [Eubacteriales bacterium]|nr:aspartate kinase [Eubacteriales bacterium]
MQKYICKFGGSSVADAEQFKKVAAIIKAVPERKFVVASAPGKRYKEDIKVTDMLYSCYNAAAAGEDYSGILGQIKERFLSIINELNIKFDIDAEMEAIDKQLKTAPSKDYMASRGEHINSKILAAYLGFEFIDSALYIQFDENGEFMAEKTNADLSKALEGKENVVIPGFYGAYPDGSIKTFSRGGSDVTGSIVARAAGVDKYENWTDVSGMLSADPRIVDSPRGIAALSYRELRDLSYMGASVLHEDAVFPCRMAGIPINIRNTNRPEDDGTMIAASVPADSVRHTITGIAGKKGYAAVVVEKSSLKSDAGALAALLKVFADAGIAAEHMPAGVDTAAVIVAEAALEGKQESIVAAIKSAIEPDSVTVEGGLTLVAAVGEGIAYNGEAIGSILKALGAAGIKVRMTDTGSSGLNFIVGVDEAQYEAAVKAMYGAVED